MIAASGYFRYSRDEWPFIDCGKECLVCGFQWCQSLLFGWHRALLWGKDGQKQHTRASTLAWNNCGFSAAASECRCQLWHRELGWRLKSVIWPLNYTRNTENTTGTACGLYTALLFNDSAMTQRFLNSSQCSFHAEVDEKYHVCLPSKFLKSRSVIFWW